VRFLSAVLLLLFALATQAPQAHAGRPTDAGAEVQRLVLEMEQFAGRNAWSGVDRAYLDLVELGEKGAELPQSAHVLGAHASKALGSTYDIWTRLTRAEALGPTEEIQTWLATIWANYGLVQLEVAPSWKAKIELGAKLDKSFAPDQLATVTQARETLQTERFYKGLLPHGSYEFGYLHFDVFGGPKLALVLKRTKEHGAPSASAPEPEVADVEEEVVPAAEDAGPEMAPSTVILLSKGDLDADTFAILAGIVKSELLGLVEIRTVRVFGASPRIFVQRHPLPNAAEGVAIVDNRPTLASLAELLTTAHALAKGTVRIVDDRLVLPEEAVASLELLVATPLPPERHGAAPLPLSSAAFARKGHVDSADPRSLVLDVEQDSSLESLLEGLAEVLELDESQVLRLIRNE
jgi:hypothetical protein